MSETERPTTERAKDVQFCGVGSCDRRKGHEEPLHRCRCGKLIDEPATGCAWHKPSEEPVEQRNRFEFAELIGDLLAFVDDPNAGHGYTDVSIPGHATLDSVYNLEIVARELSATGYKYCPLVHSVTQLEALPEGAVVRNLETGSIFERVREDGDLRWLGSKSFYKLHTWEIHNNYPWRVIHLPLTWS